MGSFFSHLIVRLWKEFGRKIQDSRLWNKLSIETLTNAGTNLFQCKSDMDCSCWNFSFRDWCFGNRWTIWLPGKNSLSNNELVTVLKEDHKTPVSPVSLLYLFFRVWKNRLPKFHSFFTNQESLRILPVLFTSSSMCFILKMLLNYCFPLQHLP